MANLKRERDSLRLNSEVSTQALLREELDESFQHGDVQRDVFGEERWEDDGGR